MDSGAEALLTVGTGVDYAKVDPINHRELLAFVNHFVTHTVHFLNKFSCVCEEKLMELSSRIQQLEVTMSLLESKLASVPGLESVTASEYRPPESVARAGGEVAAPIATSTVSAPPPPAAPSAGSVSAPTVEATVETEAAPVAMKTVYQDNRYMKYFDLIKKGVPAIALRPKMMSEGLNPDLLETPDAPVPGAGEPESLDDDEDDDDDEMFDKESSNSSEEEEDSDDFDDD